MLVTVYGETATSTGDWCVNTTLLEGENAITTVATDARWTCPITAMFTHHRRRCDRTAFGDTVLRSAFQIVVLAARLCDVTMPVRRGRQRRWERDLSTPPDPAGRSRRDQIIDVSDVLSAHREIRLHQRRCSGVASPQDHSVLTHAQPTNQQKKPIHPSNNPR